MHFHLNHRRQTHEQFAPRRFKHQKLSVVGRLNIHRPALNTLPIPRLELHGRTAHAGGFREIVKSTFNSLF